MSIEVCRDALGGTSRGGGVWGSAAKSSNLILLWGVRRRGGFRSVAEIAVFSSYSSSCDPIVRNGRQTIALFLLFGVQSCLFAIVHVKGRSKHVSNMVTTESIAVASLADVTPSPNTRFTTR